MGKRASKTIIHFNYSHDIKGNQEGGRGKLSTYPLSKKHHTLTLPDSVLQVKSDFVFFWPPAIFPKASCMGSGCDNQNGLPGAMCKRTIPYAVYCFILPILQLLVIYSPFTLENRGNSRRATRKIKRKFETTIVVHKTSALRHGSGMGHRA